MWKLLRENQNICHFLCHSFACNKPIWNHPGYEQFITAICQTPLFDILHLVQMFLDENPENDIYCQYLGPEKDNKCQKNVGH